MASKNKGGSSVLKELGQDDLKNDRVDTVTYFPAGDRGVVTPNNQQDLAGGKAKRDNMITTIQENLLNRTDVNSPEYKKRIMLDFLRRGQGAYAPNSIVELLDKVKKILSSMRLNTILSF